MVGNGSAPLVGRTSGARVLPLLARHLAPDVRDAQRRVLPHLGSAGDRRDLPEIEVCVITADHAGLFELLQSHPAGCRREANLLGECELGDAAIALDGIYVEGLLHVTELGNDYFNYDKARHEMAGERTGVRYRLGDRLRVKVARVDLETSKIDFVLVAATTKL